MKCNLFSNLSQNDNNSCGTQKKCCKKSLICVTLMIVIPVTISSILFCFQAKRYIMKNPKIIIESIENMYKEEQQKTKDMAAKKIPEIYNNILSNADLPFIGNKNGSKVVVEFFDYTCFYCKKQISEFKKLIAKSKDVKIITVDFPVMSANSVIVSQVSLYIYQNYQSKFDDFYFNSVNLKSGSVEEIKAMLTKLNIPLNVIEKAQKDEKVKSMIQKNYENGKSLSLPGTPGIMINGKLIPGFVDYESLIKELGL